MVVYFATVLQIVIPHEMLVSVCCFCALNLPMNFSSTWWIMLPILGYIGSYTPLQKNPVKRSSCNGSGAGLKLANAPAQSSNCGAEICRNSIVERCWTNYFAPKPESELQHLHLGTMWQTAADGHIIHSRHETPTFPYDGTGSVASAKAFAWLESGLGFAPVQSYIFCSRRFWFLQPLGMLGSFWMHTRHVQYHMLVIMNMIIWTTQERCTTCCTQSSRSFQS